MPKKLQELFETGEAYYSDDVVIDENNWYEVFLNINDDYDVVDIEGVKSPELETVMRAWMDCFLEKRDAYNPKGEDYEK